MADPSLEEEGLLREWTPLTSLLQQIPAKAQRGIFTHDLSLTCVDCLPDFLAVGTNLGLVYWYSRRKGDLQRLRCENTASAITCVKVISTVDFMVAAGNDLGIVTVFQIPKTPPDSVPESLKSKRNKQVERYTISGLHTTPVTAIEWSMNGMKLFSGDKNGLVVLTEIDFYMHLSKSVELLNEKYEIVQLSYCQQLLLVSTLYRSIICHREDRWRVAQVGQKERKVLGKLGATFCQGSGRPQDLLVYSSRPGLRVWLADKNGIVQQTLIYKDTMMQSHTHVPLINPAPVHLRQSKGDHRFGPLLAFRAGLLVTYSTDAVYVLDPSNISVVATVTDLRRVLGVAVSKDEIFILEGERSLVRVAYNPESHGTHVQGLNSGSRQEHQPDATFMSIPVSLSDVSVASSLMGFTSKIKESAIVPAIPFHKISLFNKGESEDQEGSNPVVTADEALELPPIVAIPIDSLTGLTVDKGGPPTEDHKVYKEVFNRSQRGSTSRRGSTVSRDSSRAELLDKIGEQQFEDVVFKPKQKRRRKKRAPKNKHLISGAESGSDTMSTNSVRSNTSDGEDPWSSERLDVSSDWSSVSTRPSSSANNDRVARRSSSEETLVRLGDSMISELGTLPPDNIEESSGFERDNVSPSSNRERRPEELVLSNHPLEEDGIIPECIQPDLRSPASIERDVANKERILAQVLDLETLYIDKNKDLTCDKVENGEISGDINKTESTCVSTQSCILVEELKGGETANSCRTEVSEIQCAGMREVCESSETHFSVEEDESELSESQDDKLASFSSVLSYGPPSGSSAPPSTHTSLEICPPGEGNFETRSINGMDADSWIQDKTPDAIMHFAICNQYVCCIDSRDTLYYSSINDYGFKWLKVDNRASKIAVSVNGSLVWKLKKNNAYALVNPSPKGPFGDSWFEAAKDVQSIAVDLNSAWFISLDSRVYVQKDLMSDRPFSTPVLVSCLFPVTRICCFQGNVWILTSTAKVLYRSGISSIVPEGKEWKEVAVPFMVVDIALGCRGTGWVVNTKNVIYFTKDFTSKTPQWWQILISDYIYQQTTPLQHLRSKLSDNYLTNLRQPSTAIIAAGEDVLCISEKMATKVHVNKIEFTGHQWCRVPLKGLSPSMRWDKISAEGIHKDNGHLIILSTNGDLFCACPDSMSLYSLPLPFSCPVVCLAATPQAVWLLTLERQLFVQQVISNTSFEGNWKAINLLQLVGICITHVSCSNDAVWACDDKGDIYMAIGSPQSMASRTFAPAWIQVEEKPQSKAVFTKVYVGPQTYMVWALDQKKNVYVREGILPNYQLGKEWVPVSGIEAVELSISETAVWALSPGGSVYRRYGITQKNYIGDYWKKIPGSLRSLTASVSDGLWAVDKHGNLLRHSQLTVKLSAHGTPTRVNDSNPSTDGDWLMV